MTKGSYFLGLMRDHRLNNTKVICKRKVNGKISLLIGSLLLLTGAPSLNASEYLEPTYYSLTYSDLDEEELTSKNEGMVAEVAAEPVYLSPSQSSPSQAAQAAIAEVEVEAKGERAPIPKSLPQRSAAKVSQEKKASLRAERNKKQRR